MVWNFPNCRNIQIVVWGLACLCVYEYCWISLVDEKTCDINSSLFVSLKTDRPNLTGSRDPSASLAMLIYMPDSPNCKRGSECLLAVQDKHVYSCRFLLHRNGGNGTFCAFGVHVCGQVIATSFSYWKIWMFLGFVCEEHFFYYHFFSQGRIVGRKKVGRPFWWLYSVYGLA